MADEKGADTTARPLSAQDESEFRFAVAMQQLSKKSPRSPGEKLAALAQIAGLSRGGFAPAESYLRTALSADVPKTQPGTREIGGALTYLDLLGSAKGDGVDLLSADEVAAVSARLELVRAAWRLDQLADEGAMALTPAATMAGRFASGASRLPEGLDHLPGTGGYPDLVNPAPGEMPVGFDFPKADLLDLLVILYGQALAALPQEGHAGTIASVEPSCVWHEMIGGGNDTPPGLVFVARPEPGENFPSPSGISLICGPNDITSEIDDWTATEIRFRVPHGAASGSLYLQGPLSMPAGRVLSTVLGRFESVFPELGRLRDLPRTGLSIVYPLSIETFGIDTGGPVPDTQEVELAACAPTAFVWAARFEHDPGLALQNCAQYRVSLWHEQTVIADGLPLEGHREIVLPEEIVGPADLTLRAELWVSSEKKQTVEQTISVVVRRHLAVRVVFPERAATSGRVTRDNSHVWLEVELPCALTSAIEPEAKSSDDTVLRANRVWPIAPGARTRIFRAEIRGNGSAEIIVTAEGHEPARIALEVIEPSTALVLSGGGAKGSFEAGAVAYLGRYQWEGLRISSITGTSVGSINALGLIENDGLHTFRKMEDVWLSLRRNSDMWEPADWLGDELAEVVEGFLSTRNKAATGGSSPEQQALRIAAVLFPLAFITNYALVAPGSLKNDIEAFIDAIDLLMEILDAAKAFEDNPPQFFFDLAPARARLTAALDGAKIAASPLKLRLCLVALEDGQIYYVTEDARLIRYKEDYQPGEQLVSSDPIANFAGIADPSERLVARLVSGAMGSSAIPAFFPPERITPAGKEALTFVDGGVREVLPIDAALELGSNVIVSVSAGKRDPSPWPNNSVSDADDLAAAAEGEAPNVEGQNSAATSSFISIAFRGIDLSISEVARTDRQTARLECNGIEHIEIYPEKEIHDTRQIDPALIRINMGYGYFRAFDAFYARDVERRSLIGASPLGQPTGTPEEAEQSTRDILEKRLAITVRETEIRRRMESWAQELRQLSVHVPMSAYRQVFLPDELAEVRQLKRELYLLIENRWLQFGAGSVPDRFGATQQLPLIDWWETWETALNPPSAVAQRLPGRPFQPQRVWRGTTLQDIARSFTLNPEEFVDRMIGPETNVTPPRPIPAPGMPLGL